MFNATGHNGLAMSWTSAPYDRSSMITPIYAQHGRATNQRATPMSKHNVRCGSRHPCLASAGASVHSGTQLPSKRALEQERIYESLAAASHTRSTRPVELYFVTDQLDIYHRNSNGCGF